MPVEDAHHNRIIHGDALEELRKLPDHSIDAVISDPPAGINFMNLKFDSDKGGRDAWVAWLAEIMGEARRVTRPGGHALIWALPRTSHWTATALENAGWEIREKLYHVFGSGYPKSHNLSKAIDKLAGIEREVIGISQNSRFNNNKMYADGKGLRGHENYQGDPITAPATPQAQQYDGWGTATKPAAEEWILCRAPLSEKSIAENVLKWGVGGINIDGTRITSNEKWACNGSIPQISPRNGDYIVDGRYGEKVLQQSHPSGRWPSNFLISHSLFCTEGACVEECMIAELDRQSGQRSMGHIPRRSKYNGSWYGKRTTLTTDKSNNAYEDKGGASRYFARFYPDQEEDITPFIYTSKASKRERNAGCEALPAKQTFDKNVSKQINRVNPDTGETTYSEYHPSSNANHHPTVKPAYTLMRYLVRLITPPGGTVLDMFMGSGSTGIACVLEKANFIGIEQEAEYVEIARARINHALKQIGGGS